MAAAGAGGAVAAASAAFMALPGAAVGVPGAGAGAGGVLPAVGQPLPGTLGAIPPGAGPIPPGVGPGGVPIGQPIPGITSSGGILPLGNSAPVTEALALLEPLGLASGLVIPVAVFPPTPTQTFPATSIIFLELSEAPVRKSLTLWVSKEKNLAMRSRKYKAVGRHNAFEEIRESLKRRLQKLALNLKCFLPRLKHNLMQHELQNNSRLKKKLTVPIIQKRRSSVTHNRQMRVTKMQIFAKNCFPEPKYGFRTKVTLVDNKSCVIGSSCDNTTISDNSYDFRRHPGYLPTNEFTRRQTGEEFSSDGPPDCRVTIDTSSTCIESLTSLSN